MDLCTTPSTLAALLRPRVPRSLRALTAPPRQLRIGCCNCSNRPDPGGPIRPRHDQIKSYPPSPVRVHPFGFLGSRLPETRCSTPCYLRSSAQCLSLGAGNPRKDKTVKSPPIGRFYEFLRRAGKTLADRNRVLENKLNALQTEWNALKSQTGTTGGKRQ